MLISVEVTPVVLSSSYVIWKSVKYIAIYLFRIYIKWPNSMTWITLIICFLPWDVLYLLIINAMSLWTQCLSCRWHSGATRTLLNALLTLYLIGSWRILIATEDTQTTHMSTTPINTNGFVSVVINDTLSVYITYWCYSWRLISHFCLLSISGNPNSVFLSKDSSESN